jgi:large subunit ribosomal protein L3
MGKTRNPRKGSLAYSPRKRAGSQVPRYKSWQDFEGAPFLQAFAGYKVGMTHVVMVDDHKSSPTEGKDVVVPVTVVEVPALRVTAIRAYTGDSLGPRPLTEVWSETLDPALSRRIPVPKEHDRAAILAEIEKGIVSGDVIDLRAVVQTQPGMVTGIPKKTPELLEIRIGGDNLPKRFEFARSVLGREVKAEDVVKVGQYVDVTAVTRGKGTQGPVKRWGVKLRKRKHRVGRARHVGTLGPWHPHHIRWQVPALGQMGYQQRTEPNKRVLKIGDNGSDVTPKGGFLHYGEVRNPYILVKGSIPGPAKRLIRIRPAVRQGEHKFRVPVIQHVSTQSKQG